MPYSSVLDKDIEKILITPEQIDEATTRISDQISRDFKDSKHLLLVCILKGSVVFMGDLMKKISIPVEIDFMKVQSYFKETSSTGKLTFHLDIHREDLSECDLIIVEDIVDSGHTLSHLTKHLQELGGAKSVHTCTLLDKPCRRKVDFEPDYCGFIIPDEFVVGYGLDYDEMYRALPYIGVLKPEIYTK